MKKSSYLLIMVILVFLGLIITSCEDNSNDIGNQSGKFSIKITDAPMDYKQFMEVGITIDKIEIRKLNSSNSDDIIVLSNEPFTTNMLNLVNGITKTLVDSNLPVGDYDLIRLYFSSTKMILKNGKKFTNDMDYTNSDENNNWNGGMMNGGMMNDNMMINGKNKSIDIPINPYFTVENGMNETFLLDLDINQSFQCNDVNFGNMGAGNWMDMSGYSFTPVMRFVQLSETGTITGNVQNGNINLSEATVYLMQGNKIYTTTHTDKNGDYKFIGIPKGNYIIDVELEGYMNNSDYNVNMNPGDITNVDCTMTPTHS